MLQVIEEGKFKNNITIQKIASLASRGVLEVGDGKGRFFWINIGNALFPCKQNEKGNKRLENLSLIDTLKPKVDV